MEGVGWLQLSTLVIAVIGAVLSIVNTARALSNDRVRVRVTPSYSVHMDAQFTEFMSIEVVNLSTFAVTVNNFGFMTGNGQQLVPQAFRLSTADFLPKRLGSRESFSIFLAPGETSQDLYAQATRAFVTLACGTKPQSSKRDLAKAMHNLNKLRKT